MIKLKPPMGWNTWNTFAEKIDEKLIMESADAMVENGLLEAGYEYLVIDDCWSEHHRDEKNRLIASKEKFPHGMKYIADYIHSKGLLFGIYSCAGNMTCAGFPGSFEYEYIDAKTFAEYGVDFLKYDYCYKPIETPGHLLYKRMGNALANCGRDILFNACSWGYDDTENWIKTTNSNMWRSTGDISDCWASIHNIHTQQLRFQAFNSINCFNDMDMLVVGMNGNGHVGLTGCSFEEYKTHFSLWAILNSPLIIGCDIRNMSDDTKKILLNKSVIAINQDKSCRQPFLIGAHPWPDDNEDYVWVKMLENGDLAIGIFNMGETDTNIKFSLFDLGLGRVTGKTLLLTELWTNETELIKNEVVMKNVKAHNCKIYRGKIVDNNV